MIALAIELEALVHLVFLSTVCGGTYLVLVRWLIPNATTPAGGLTSGQGAGNVDPMNHHPDPHDTDADEEFDAFGNRRTLTYHRNPNHCLGRYDIDGNTYTFHDVEAADGTTFVVTADTREDAYAAAWAAVDRVGA